MRIKKAAPRKASYPAIVAIQVHSRSASSSYFLENLRPPSARQGALHSEPNDPRHRQAKLAHQTSRRRCERCDLADTNAPQNDAPSHALKQRPIHPRCEHAQSIPAKTQPMGAHQILSFETHSPNLGFLVNNRFKITVELGYKTAA